MAERLAEKSKIAEDITGGVRDSSRASADLSTPEASAQIAALLQGWCADMFEDLPPTECVYAQVAASEDCFVAMACNGSGRILLGGTPNKVSDDPRVVLHCMKAMSNYCVALDEDIASRNLAVINAWIAQHSLANTLGINSKPDSSRRRVARKIDVVAAHAPTHRRVSAALLADKVRSAIGLDYNAAGEAILEGLSITDADDEWLARLISAGEKSGNRKAGTSDGSGFTVRALLIGSKRR